MICLEHIKKIYDEGKDSQLIALNNVNWKIERGDFIALVGVSGSGKTTLMNILGMMDCEYDGKYLWDGNDTGILKESERCHYRNKKIGFVVQDFALIEDYTVRENVQIPLDYSYEKLDKKSKVKKIDECLEYLGIADKKDVKVGKLSGGQKQRVAIARAIVNEPEMVLADEPTGALDRKNTTEVMEILKRLNSSGKTVIVITHDNYVADYCNHIYNISDGNINFVR